MTFDAEQNADTDAPDSVASNPTPLTGAHDDLGGDIGSAPSEMRTPWVANDYHPTISMSGARKLAASGVAPLVAVARGYETVLEEQAKDFADRWKVGGRNTARGRQFHGCFQDGSDVLAMPWYPAGDQFDTYDSIDRRPFVRSLQLRPAIPRVNDAGKPVKYEFLTGQDTVLDFHPSSTRAWIDSAPRVLIAEGLIKGDSALTAQLRQYVDDRELSLTDADKDRVHAIRRLARLLEQIPTRNRVAILTVAGVGNWRHNPEWVTVRLNDKEVLIAFDADVETNWQVWHQADQMFKFLEQNRKATPYLVDISRNERGFTARAMDQNLGLDDFFATVGDWTDIEEMLADTLPERPPRPDDDRVGEWRVATDGKSVEQCVRDDQTGRVSWERRVGIGGRVLNSEVRRAATDDERRGKPFGHGVREAEYPKFVTVEVSWEGTLGPRTVEIVGPEVIMEQHPRDWSRLGAQIPTDLRLHREWPPTKGFEWLSAVKANREEAREHITTWTTMGYVPVEGEKSQAFIIGDQVIAANPNAAKSTRAGVTDATLARASEFGVADVYQAPEFEDPRGVHDIRQDIRDVLRCYVTEGPWMTLPIAITVLAQALRPVVPSPTITVGYHVGPPQKGKSWTARHQMAFWQASPGTWRHALPGSANDTFASTEAAVSQTPIWVADDLAPSSDRRAAEAAEAKIGDLIRAAHNKLGKRRLNGSSMTAREVPTPMALLILTAENEPRVASIQERIVRIEFTGLRSANMKPIEAMNYRGTTAARITAALIRMYIDEGEQAGWENLVARLETQRAADVADAKLALELLGIPPKDQTRPAEMIADLALGLRALEELMDILDMDDELDNFSWGRGGWYKAIAEQVSLSHQHKDSPGRVLMDSIRQLLATGRAHITNADDPSRPPVTGDDQHRTNMMLGWAPDGQGEMRPRGVTIGWLTEIKSNSETLIYLSPDDAFNEASKAYPNRILPGTSPATMWKDVWNSPELIHPRHVGRPPKSGLRKDWRTAGGARVYGVPVSMESLFPAVEPVEDEQEG